MRKTLLTALALALALLGATSPSAATTHAPNTTTSWETCEQAPRGRARSSDALFARANIWIFGDSITYQNRGALYRTLPYGGVAADAYWGRATAPTVQALGRTVHGTSHRPSVAVMAVGTNDISSPSGMAAQVRLARAVLPLSTRLVWVNTYVAGGDHGVAVNVAIASVPGVQVVDWAGYNRAWLRPDGTSPLLSDGIHLTCQGQWAWVNLLHRAIMNP